MNSVSFLTQEAASKGNVNPGKSVNFAEQVDQGPINMGYSSIFTVEEIHDRDKNRVEMLPSGFGTQENPINDPEEGYEEKSTVPCLDQGGACQTMVLDSVWRGKRVFWRMRYASGPSLD